jgi:hypothetical protein
MSEWKPIETAPKDGRHVLLACIRFVCEGYHESDERGWFQANTHWTDTVDGSVIPTHWMRLPAPPKESTP